MDLMVQGEREREERESAARIFLKRAASFYVHYDEFIGIFPCQVSQTCTGIILPASGAQTHIK